MAYVDFAQQLMQAKRIAALRGRPLSARDISGISAGVTAGAEDRNIARRELDLKQQGVDIEAGRLAALKDQDLWKREVAERALDLAKRNQTTGLLIGGASYLAGPTLQRTGEGVANFAVEAIKKGGGSALDWLGDVGESFMSWF